MVSRRRAIGAIAAGMSGLSVGVQAQQYPTRPLRIISPNPPGGGVDNGARMVAEILPGDTAALPTTRHRYFIDGSTRRLR